MCRSGCRTKYWNLFYLLVFILTCIILILIHIHTRQTSSHTHAPPFFLLLHQFKNDSYEDVKV